MRFIWDNFVFFLTVGVVFVFLLSRLTLSSNLISSHSGWSYLLAIRTAMCSVEYFCCWLFGCCRFCIFFIIFSINWGFFRFFEACLWLFGCDLFIVFLRRLFFRCRGSWMDLRWGLSVSISSRVERLILRVWWCWWSIDCRTSWLVVLWFIF